MSEPTTVWILEEWYLEGSIIIDVYATEAAAINEKMHRQHVTEKYRLATQDLEDDDEWPDPPETGMIYGELKIHEWEVKH